MESSTLGLSPRIIQGALLVKRSQITWKGRFVNCICVTPSAFAFIMLIVSGAWIFFARQRILAFSCLLGAGLTILSINQARKFRHMKDLELTNKELNASVQTLRECVDNAKETNCLLKNNIHTLENRLKEMTKTIDDLAIQNERLKENLERFEKQNNNLNNGIIHFREQNLVLMKTKEELEHQVGAFQSEIKELKESIGNLNLLNIEFKEGALAQKEVVVRIKLMLEQMKTETSEDHKALASSIRVFDDHLQQLEEFQISEKRIAEQSNHEMLQVAQSLVETEKELKEVFKIFEKWISGNKEVDEILSRQEKANQVLKEVLSEQQRMLKITQEYNKQIKEAEITIAHLEEQRIQLHNENGKFKLENDRLRETREKFEKTRQKLENVATRLSENKALDIKTVQSIIAQVTSDLQTASQK